MTRIRPGEPAPVFSACAHDGRQISLADFRGKQVVVLFFYPMDGTLFCTQEARAFRDRYDEFLQAGAAVVGVSRDGLDRHRQFAAGCQLPFPLLSDADGALHRAFGVPRWLGFLPGRVTYVIDHEGFIRHVFNSQLFPRQHVVEALETVRRLVRNGGPGSQNSPDATGKGE